jgi:ActD protein
VRREFIVAVFRSAEDLVTAVRRVRWNEFRIYDVYSPYPIHEMDAAMGVRHSRLPWVTAISGLTGLILAIGFQFYANVLDWSLNVGGKPDNSTLAFIPITFELTVLVGGLTTLAALFLRARLYPGKRERLPALEVTNDKFALVIRKRESTFDVHRAKALLWESGAEHVEETEGEL